jgi:hypothetical protein
MIAFILWKMKKEFKPFPGFHPFFSRVKALADFHRKCFLYVNSNSLDVWNLRLFHEKRGEHVIFSFKQPSIASMREGLYGLHFAS